MKPLTKDNFAQQAEQVIKDLRTTDRKGNPKIDLTTSKIRNLLSMVNVLYNKGRLLKSDELGDDLRHDIQYLKMRFAYEAGREKTVGEFVDKADIMAHIDAIGNQREKLILFCNYVESLVAYHRYYGGKDR